MTFETALARTLGHEGGVSNHPLDRGGLTKWGVTQRAYDNYRGRHQRPLRPVTEMGEGEMRELYLEDYWQPCGCDQMPDALAGAVFDMAVNSGIGAAKRTLQRSLGVKVDGIVGEQTLAAALARGSVLDFMKKRAAFIQQIIITRPDQVAFLEGWMVRMLEQLWEASP